MEDHILHFTDNMLCEPKRGNRTLQQKEKYVCFTLISSEFGISDVLNPSPVGQTVEDVEIKISTVSVFSFYLHDVCGKLAVLFFRSCSYSFPRLVQ